MSEYKAKLTARLNPSNSAVFTLGSLIVSSALCALGAYFIYLKSWAGGCPLIVAGMLGMIASFFLGFKSQKDQDLAQARPLEMRYQADGTFELSADPRTDRQIMLDVVAASADMLRARRPLPDPSGKIDSNGNIEKEKAVDALSEVSLINKEIEEDLIKLRSTIFKKVNLDKRNYDENYKPTGVVGEDFKSP